MTLVQLNCLQIYLDFSIFILSHVNILFSANGCLEKDVSMTLFVYSPFYKKLHIQSFVMNRVLQ